MPQRRYRKRKRSSESEEEREGEEEEKGEDAIKKLAETKEIQKFRKKPAGVSAVGLAFGEKFTEEEKLAPDPFQLETGGLVDMAEIKPSDFEKSEDELLQRLQSTFSAETKLKDDETHMMQYIEQEMTKKKGAKKEEENISSYEAKMKALYQLPDHLQTQSKSKTEEMLSNQMLSGIPEVDLGLDAKFKNIEETERAKQQLIEEQMKKKQEKLSLAPRNMATNFTLHSLRFHKDKRESAIPKAAPKDPVANTAYIPVVGENEPELKPANTADLQKKKVDQSQLATDDYYYDKYRKKTRHH